MARKYNIFNDVKIKKYSNEEILEKLKTYIKNDESSTQVKEKPIDKSRSGREWNEVCNLLKKGKSKEQIFEEMKAFKKWTEAPEQYRELTYKKALKEIEDNPQKEKKKKEKRSTLSMEQVNELEKKDFNGFCLYVQRLYSSYFKEDRVDGEDLVVKYLLNKYYFLTPDDSN